MSRRGHHHHHHHQQQQQQQPSFHSCCAKSGYAGTRPDQSALSPPLIPPHRNPNYITHCCPQPLICHHLVPMPFSVRDFAPEHHSTGLVSWPVSHTQVEHIYDVAENSRRTQDKRHLALLKSAPSSPAVAHRRPRAAGGHNRGRDAPAESHVTPLVHHRGKKSNAGCCVALSMMSASRRPLSGSYSALDALCSKPGTQGKSAEEEDDDEEEEEEDDADDDEVTKLGKAAQLHVSDCVKNLVNWIDRSKSAFKEALPAALKHDYHVVMVGLESAGKSTVLYRLKLDQYVNTMPTVGFNCERVRGSMGRSRHVTFLMWDVGGHEKVRPLWRPYTRATDAIIFVVDSSDPDEDRMEEARFELHKIMKTPDNVGIPLLVIANKQDLPDARPVQQVEAVLALDKLGYLWHIEPVCAVTGEGLPVALEALLGLIRKRKLLKKRARNKTR